MEECLNSIQNQTLSEIEIILINDGSTDGSKDIIHSYQERDGRIISIDKANSGYGDSLNKGLEIASGEYICIVESDDFIPNDFLELLYDEAESPDVPLDIIKTDYNEFNDDMNEVRHFEKRSAIKNEQYYNKVIPDVTPDLLIDVDTHNWNGLYRNSFIKEHGIRHNNSPGASYQDTGFRFQCLTQADSILFTHGPRYNYRVDNKSSSIHTNDSKVFAIADEYSFVEGCLRNNESIDRYNDALDIIRYESYKWNYDHLTHDNKKKFVNRWKMELKRHKNRKNRIKPKKQALDEWMIRNLTPGLYVRGLTIKRRLLNS